MRMEPKRVSTIYETKGKWTQATSNSLRCAVETASEMIKIFGENPDDVEIIETRYDNHGNVLTKTFIF